MTHVSSVLCLILSLKRLTHDSQNFLSKSRAELSECRHVEVSNSSRYSKEVAEVVLVGTVWAVVCRSECPILAFLRQRTKLNKEAYLPIRCFAILANQPTIIFD